MPSYIHHDAFLDNLGSLFIGEGVVVSTKAIILTHDYSYLVGLKSIGCENQDNGSLTIKKVEIKDYAFIGAGSIILPGTTIGEYSIVGAGCVCKGNIPPYSVVVGNPCKIIGDTRDLGKKKINLLKY